MWYDDHRTHGRKSSHAVALSNRLPHPASAAETIQTMEAGDARTSALAAKNLIQILPQITEAEGAMLQPQHRAGLQRALRGYNASLILAILHAPESVLDPAALPNVQRLTKCPNWIAESEEIQKAARKALAALEADAKRRQTVQTSLRASSTPTTPAKELLRQTAFVPGAAAHGLLRAGNAVRPPTED